LATVHLGRIASGSLVLAAAMALLGAASAIAVPQRFWGVVPQASPSPAQLERLRQGGVDSVRLPVSWAAVQPSPGRPPDFSGLDGEVGNLARANLELLPFLYDAPRWAVRPHAVPGSPGSARAPLHLPAAGAAGRAWASFVRAAVQRYGPSGSFWSENPSLPKRPVHFWQVWNEENFKYFVVRPNPAEYGQLVKRSARAIHAVDPHAQVILGGLFARPGEAARPLRPPQAYFAADFLRRMYRRTPGVRAAFDGVALHPYSASYQRLGPEVEEVRAALRDGHDAGAGLWITELGWSSEPPSRRDSFAKGLHGQAAQLKGAFSLLRSHRRRWRLQRVFWFSVDDAPGVCNFCGGTGLFGPGFRPKPAWHAYVRFAS
jgi:hypothetical protein